LNKQLTPVTTTSRSKGTRIADGILLERRQPVGLRKKVCPDQEMMHDHLIPHGHEVLNEYLKATLLNAFQ